ncbi:MAG: response regulator transcription factor [Acidobacteria bacterium]|nr:response regulator transcription factor [Acidobacteriota bacterium]
MSEREHVRVMVVDDHQMFAQGLMKVLGEEPDFEVVGVASGVEEARRLARLHHPDVILMDFDLPDGDGAKATELIRAERPETRVVMLTSFTDEAVLVAAIEAGCSGYVTKHKAVEEVARAVRAADAGEALISPSMLARLLPKLRRSYRGLGSDLTPREIELLRLLAEGLANRAIAERLLISLHTVRNHVQNILTKLQAHSKLEAVAVAVREGVIRFP